MDPIDLLHGMLPLLGGVLIGGSAVAMTGVLWYGRTQRVSCAHELEHLVRGRQAVLEVLARDGPLDFADVYARLRPPPGPERLADWLVSMIADGSLHASMDAQGRAVFVRTRIPGPAPLPRVTVDTTRARRLGARRAGPGLEDHPGRGAGEGL
ncbi:MAG: hypothetical protein WAN74_08450 [Thermoplasmata archaeon]